MNWQKFFQALMATEENLIPVFIHNPKSQQLAGIFLLTESAAIQTFAPAPAPAPTT